MAVVGNIEETTASVVLDEGLWMGTRDGSTAWLNGIAGVAAGDAEGGVKLMILTVVPASTGATSINLATTGITGVSGSAALALLSIGNESGGGELPTKSYVSGSTLHFVVASGADGDTHRLTFLYA